MGEGVDLALQLFHPVTRKPGPVAFGVTERQWTDIRNPDVGLAAVTFECAQNRVVRTVAADEPFRGVGMAGPFYPDDPVAGPGQKDNLARERVVLAANVLDVDFPAQVSRSDHDHAHQTT